MLYMMCCNRVNMCSGSVPASIPIKLSNGKRYSLLDYNASIYETTLKHV